MGYPMAANGTCAKCLSASHCTVVACADNHFNDGDNVNNCCEEGCLSVANGSCETGSSSSQFTGVSRDDNRFNEDGIEKVADWLPHCRSWDA